MRRGLALAGRMTLTLAFVAVAAVIGWNLWIYYEDAPWTRDGRVSADVVQVAPDVSGLISQVAVHDNETVHVGQLLFQIDPIRFRLALEQAQAVVLARQAAAAEAARELARYQHLTQLEVSQEQAQQRAAASEEAQASYQQAVVDRDTAQLNLDRTAVRATVNGTITNFDLRPGDYVTTGQAVSALVDSDSFHVEGYFEETKLPRIKVGDPVKIHLMGMATLLQGRVQSIAAGIADRERDSSGNLLANINPTFSWVRLAQRVPVRIALVDVPASVHLVSGRTATVLIDAPGGHSGLALPRIARNALSAARRMD